MTHGHLPVFYLMASSLRARSRYLAITWLPLRTHFQTMTISGIFNSTFDHTQLLTERSSDHVRLTKRFLSVDNIVT